MPTYKCPNWIQQALVALYGGEDKVPDDDIVRGCGAVFEQDKDDDGLVDCPNCGIWFNPKLEPETIVKE
jgi:hypothetical protein